MIEYWKCVFFINFFIWITNGQQNPVLGTSPHFSGNSAIINYLLNEFSNRNNPVPQYNQFTNQGNTNDIISRLLNQKTNNNGPQIKPAFSKSNQNNINNIVSKLLNTKSETESHKPNPHIVNNYILVPTDFLNNNSAAENIQIDQSKFTDKITNIKNKNNQGEMSEKKRRKRRRKSQNDSTTQNENPAIKRKINRKENVNEAKISNIGPNIQQQIRSDNPIIANNIKVNSQPLTNSNTKNSNFLENGQTINTPYSACPYNEPKMTNAFIGYVPQEYYPVLPQNNVNLNSLYNNFVPDYNNIVTKSNIQIDRSSDSLNNDIKTNMVSQVPQSKTQNVPQLDSSVNRKEQTNPDNNDESKQGQMGLDDKLKSKFNIQEAVIKQFQHMFPGIPETVVRNLMTHLKRQLENGKLNKNNDVQKFNENSQRSEQYNMPYGMPYPMYYGNNNNCRCRSQPRFLHPSYRVQTQRCPNSNNLVRKAMNSKPNRKIKVLNNNEPKKNDKSDISDEKLKAVENSSTVEINDEKIVPIYQVVNFEIENKDDSQNYKSTETEEDSNKPIIEKEIMTFRIPPTLESPNFLTRKVDVPFENKYPEYNNHPVYNTIEEEPEISKTDNKNTKNEQDHKETPKLETTYAHSKVAKYSPSTNKDEGNVKSNDSHESHTLTSDNATIVIAESMPYEENDTS